MQRFKFPIWVAITSLALVLGITVIGVVVLPGALVATAAPYMAGAAFGHDGSGGPWFSLPPELQGLGDLPPAERFAHVAGVQVNLTDKDNRPVSVHVTPGTVTSASATSLTIAANDGTSRTFALTDKTSVHGKSGAGGQASLSQRDQVIVVTLNDDPAARAVIDRGTDGFAAGWDAHAGPHPGR